MKNANRIPGCITIMTMMALLTTASPAFSQQKALTKKGLGSWGQAISGQALTQLRLHWYYNWTPVPKKETPADVEFVPMFWSGADITPSNIELVKDSGANAVLGFNEPDHQGQSEMTVNECLDYWPQLMVLKQRLGSPAPADPAWLDKFMAGAKARGLRVDFLCVHIYPDFTNPNAVDDVEKILKDVHDKYGLPIWLTECGTADYKAWHLPRYGDPSAEKAQAFLKKLIPMLDSLPFVERYAWFSDTVGDEYGLGSIFDLHSKKITAMGEIFRDAP